jgi:hypothetical protein
LIEGANEAVVGEALRERQHARLVGWGVLAVADEDAGPLRLRHRVNAIRLRCDMHPNAAKIADSPCGSAATIWLLFWSMATSRRLDDSGAGCGRL